MAQITEVGASVRDRGTCFPPKRHAVGSRWGRSQVSGPGHGHTAWSRGLTGAGGRTGRAGLFSSPHCRPEGKGRTLETLRGPVLLARAVPWGGGQAGTAQTVPAPSVGDARSFLLKHKSTCHPLPQPPAPPRVLKGRGGRGTCHFSLALGGHLPHCPLPPPAAVFWGAAGMPDGVAENAATLPGGEGWHG